MNTQPDFQFDRTLTTEELNFWSTFFDHCPFSDYCYIQSFVSAFAKETTIKFDLEEYYEKIKSFTDKDELIQLFDKSDLPEMFKQNYPKVLSKLEKIFLNSKPLDLFFMSLYSGFCQNMNFELTSNGVNLLPNSRPTHVAELAFLVDFMGERATQIFPHLNIQPIKINGEKTYTNNRSKAVYTLSISKSLVRRLTNENPNNKYDFAFEVGYDFSKNTNDKLEIYSSLGYEQEKLLKLIQKNYLEYTLQINKNRYNNKTKI
jgi:hypothetical protein